MDIINYYCSLFLLITLRLVGKPIVFMSIIVLGIILSNLLSSINGQHGWAVIFGFTHGGYYTVVTLFLKSRTKAEDLAMGIGLTVGFKDRHGKKKVTAVWSTELIGEHF